MSCGQMWSSEEMQVLIHTVCGPWRTLYLSNFHEMIFLAVLLPGQCAFQETPKAAVETQQFGPLSIVQRKGQPKPMKV